MNGRGKHGGDYDRGRIDYPLPLSSFVKIVIKLHLPGKSRLIFNFNSLR